MSPDFFRWPPDANDPTAVRIETGTEIACALERAFDFVTNASLWHTWHPATASVRGVPSRPLVTGDTMLESIRAVGRRFDALWTVLACERPRLWVISTSTENGAARIAYRLEPIATGCRFHRTLEFRSRRWPWRALDRNVACWMLSRQSQRALRNLKMVLERAHGPL